MSLRYFPHFIVYFEMYSKEFASSFRWNSQYNNMRVRSFAHGSFHFNRIKLLLQNLYHENYSKTVCRPLLYLIVCSCLFNRICLFVSYLSLFYFAASRFTAIEKPPALIFFICIFSLSQLLKSPTKFTCLAEVAVSSLSSNVTLQTGFLCKKLCVRSLMFF
jgi:hypothetical protein